jgi:hypothetical protein
MKLTLAAFLISIACFAACNKNKPTTGGLSPQEALSTFELADDFKIELVAV